MTVDYRVTLTDSASRRLEKLAKKATRWRLRTNVSAEDIPIVAISQIEVHEPPVSKAAPTQRFYTEAELTERLRELETAHRENLTNVRHEIELEFEQKKRQLRKDNAAASRKALLARITEHVAPLLGDFPYPFKEVRHFGEIFDFLVFEGIENGSIKNVIFLEVKTGSPGRRVTNPREVMLRSAIESGRVKYEVYEPKLPLPESES